MVKHAADDDEPLLTAEERVDRAVRAVTAGRTFTDEQQQVARPHPRAPGRRTCRSTGRTSTTCPVSPSRGGWGRANRVFDGQLDRSARRTQRG